MSHDSFETMRRAMVASQLRTNSVSDPAVLAAMGSVAREAFVPAERKALAYVDTVVPLGGGRALNPPMVTGRLLSEAAPRAGERALVLASAAGYAAALLAEMGLHVVAVEDGGTAPEPERAGIERVQGPLAQGWPAGAPYDVILIDGAVEAIPQALVDQLGDGGRLAAALIERGVSRLVIGRKSAGSFGTVAFTEAEAASLPGFEQPRVFSF